MTEGYPVRIAVTGIPPRLKDKEITHLVGVDDKVGRALDAMRKKQSIFITGACGTGKTHLAKTLLVSATSLYPRTSPEMGKWIRFHFLPSSEFFFELKGAFNNAGEEEKLMLEWSISEWLVIDDIGSEKVSDWSRQMLYLLIDRRYRNMMPTIITSNLTLKQLSEQIDDRIASRIYEMGIVVDMGNVDYRFKKGTK